MKVRELEKLLIQCNHKEKEVKVDALLDEYLRVDSIVYNDKDECYVLKI